MGTTVLVVVVVDTLAIKRLAVLDVEEMRARPTLDKLVLRETDKVVCTVKPVVEVDLFGSLSVDPRSITRSDSLDIEIRALVDLKVDVMEKSRDIEDCVEGFVGW